MTEAMIDHGNKIAAGYAAMVADFAAASAALKHDTSRHATTLAAAYGAFAAGYVAAAAAADQAGASAPFPLLSLPDAPSNPSPLDVLTLSEAAAYLRLPEDAVRAAAESGRLAGQNVGGEWRFVRAGIVAWLQSPRLSERKPRLPPPAVEETPEEHAAFLASIQAYRDEIDRVTGHGKYAPE
jgi:excisionase family DNA binding protein